MDESESGPMEISSDWLNFQELVPFDKPQDDAMSVLQAVHSLDCNALLELLPDSSQQPRLTPELMRSVFFQAVDALLSLTPFASQHLGPRMVYLLRSLGGNINRQDEKGDTPLLRYLKGTHPDGNVVEAFLRCNSDVYLENQNGVSPLAYVQSSLHIPAEVKDIFTKYVPGVWDAVLSDDAMEVRKLINQWCRVDVQKNGKTLLQTALEVGTENIIRVVSGIRPSMEFVHSVLAGDTQMVRRMLRVKLKININFRNLGDRGKTPLFYALQQGNTEMVNTLLDRGARVDITLKGEQESDIPLYFAALNSNPAIPTSLLKVVTPMSPIRVDYLFYKGRNILFYCIENRAGELLVDFLLAKGSAYLVAQRVQDNKCPRDAAIESNCDWMIRAIDNAVVQWMYQTEELNRQILVLHGYQYIPVAIQNQQGVHETAQVETFYRHLSTYRDQINLLHKAVEECDEETVRQIIYFRHPDEHSLDPCLADSRKMGDGQPLLHKAVLRGSVEVAHVLAETLVYQRKQRLDTVRDQFFRTALHYAYGTEDNKQMINLLLDYGASEFTMDKDNRSPLSFKDRVGQKLMNDLLQYQYMQDFSLPEPDPWVVPMPIPVIDFLLTACSHSNNRPYVSHSNYHHLTTSTSCHLNPLASSDLSVVESRSSSSNQNGWLAKSHKYKSVSDTKLHRLHPSKPSFASHIAHLPDVVKSRLTKRPTHGKHSIDSLHKDYLPLPLDNPRDSDEEFDLQDDSTDSRDLLDQKEMSKSTSCCLQ